MSDTGSPQIPTCLSLVVPRSLDGERLDRAVATMVGLSRSRVADLVSTGGIGVDGTVVHTRSQAVAEGQEVSVEWVAPPTGRLRADAGVELDVLAADEAVIVIDKAPGVVTHPGAGRIEATLAAGVLARFPEVAGVGDPARPGIVHRLDMGTSGLIVVARTQAAYDSLVEQLGRRLVRRRYTALVWGAPSAERGVVDAPIGRSRQDRTRMAVAAAGRSARTRYQVVERFDRPRELSLLHCWLETGRTHQIRVHLSSIGHPVVGDTRYGGERPALVLDRPFLHAAELGFRHPVTGEEVEWSSPLPHDLASVLAGLGSVVHP